MIVPCIDLMDGKIVQLIQGRDKALELSDPDELLERFSGFPEIQVIDLDAALNRGSNDALVRYLCSKATCRVGGGVRTIERATALWEQGASKAIVGTAAFTADGVNTDFLAGLDPLRTVVALDSRGGHIVVKGWRESMPFSAEEVLRRLEPYCSGFLCTYVDKEGMLQGTDLAWFRRLRAATSHEITAAGGITTYDEVRALIGMNVRAAVGMAVYTGRMDLRALRGML